MFGYIILITVASSMSAHLSLEEEVMLRPVCALLQSDREIR